MQSKGIFLCLVTVKVRLSEGLQWGYWRVMWRWGCRLAKRRSHTHALCPPGSHAERDRSGACIWGAAPGRHTDELMKRYAVRLAGVTRRHPCYQSSRVELGPTTPGWGTWGQGHIKGIECPPPSMRGWGWSQRRETERIKTKRCGAK